jgi:hypothetical protein
MTTGNLVGIHQASAFSSHIGKPLTTFLTVDWRSAPGFHADRPDAWDREHRSVVRGFERFLRENDIDPTYLYVRERVVGRGAHTHFMIHIPPDRWRKLGVELEQHLRRLCEKRGYTEPNAVHASKSCWAGGMSKPGQRKGVLRYLSKGLNPNELFCDGWGFQKLTELIGVRPASQASLPCKRVGWSQNIGEAVRRKTGWRELTDVPGLMELSMGEIEPSSGPLIGEGHA